MKRTTAVILRTFRRLSLRKIAKLFAIWFAHPLLGILSFYATLRTYEIAVRYFPQSNSTDGIGNAYRHALWCCLILMYCCKVSSPRKSLDFCKKITSLHEDLFPNDSLQKAMDLHNNEVGMKLFMSLLPGIHRQFFETAFFTDLLFEKTKTAVKVAALHEISGSELVYLID